MKVSKQLFIENYNKPKDFHLVKTSKLMSNGVISYNPNKGIPFYLPIGRKILKKLQNLILQEAENQDLYEISVPYLVRNEILGEEKDITETFFKRIIKLKNDSLKGYHLRTTPEPSIIDLAKMSQIHHSQLPIRYVFNTESFMGVQSPKNILRGYQFNSFIGASLDANKDSLNNSFSIFKNLSKNILKKLKIPFLEVENENEKVEFFYETNEGDNIWIPEISEKIKGISLGMVYPYNGNSRKLRFKEINNKNKDILYCTFGLGIQRILYAFLDSNRDSKGFNLRKMSPFDISIIPINKNYFSVSLELYKKLMGDKLLDDRKNKNWGEKVAFSDYIGIPYKIIINERDYILKDRSEKRIKKFKTLEDLVKITGYGR